MTNAEAHTIIHCLSQSYCLYNIHTHKYLVNKYKAVWMYDIYLLYDLFVVLSVVDGTHHWMMMNGQWTGKEMEVVMNYFDIMSYTLPAGTWGKSFKTSQERQYLATIWTGHLPDKSHKCYYI